MRNMEYPFRVPPACFLTMTALSFTMKGTVRQKTVTIPSAGNLTTIGTLQGPQRIDDILFAVYTERIIRDEPGKPEEVIRLISARMATSFERGVYYGKIG